MLYVIQVTGDIDQKLISLVFATLASVSPRGDLLI